MTDNEIIKVLECCGKPVSENCKECPLCSQDCLDIDPCELALDLINRQQAENESLKDILYDADGVNLVNYWYQQYEITENCCRNFQEENKNLQAENERLNKEVDRLSQCVLYHDGQVADAIKEFAERLKKEFLALEYQANTSRKTVPIDFMKDQIKWVLQDVSVETIDNLVKEMVGEQE